MEHRFTMEEAEAIRFAYNPDTPGRGYKGLAKIWDCDPMTIKNIIKGNTYTKGATARRQAWLEKNGEKVKDQERTEKLSKSIPKPKKFVGLIQVNKPREFSGKCLAPKPFIQERTDEEIGW